MDFHHIWVRWIEDDPHQELIGVFRIEVVNMSIDQHGGKTESERFQRLLAMTIWTGYVGSTFMVLNKAQVEPEAGKGPNKPSPWGRYSFTTTHTLAHIVLRPGL